MNRDGMIKELLELHKQKQATTLNKYKKKLIASNTCILEQEYNLVKGIKPPEPVIQPEKPKIKKRYLKKVVNRSINNTGEEDEKRTRKYVGSVSNRCTKFNFGE